MESHAIPGARFVDPKVLSRIKDLKLLARSVVDGFINGLHKAPYFGASVDFAEHRGYVPGDDIRRMDWRLWARTDRYYIKEYEAESNMNFSVLMDVSKSMLVTDVAPDRLTRARELASGLLAALPGDRAAGVVFAGAAAHFPLTDDHEVTRRFIEDLGPADLPSGSNLIEALRTAR